MISSAAAGALYAQLSSLAVCVNPGSAFNCYWEMPFRKRCRITMTNIGDEPHAALLSDQLHADRRAGGCAYFHAQFRRSQSAALQRCIHNPGRRPGQGHYVGTYMAWGVNNSGWWGEGEIKFFMDGDGEFPTICGTGTEDYFCGSYNFENRETRQYQEFTTPYAGLHQVIRPDGVYRSQTALWHVSLAHYGPDSLPAGSARDDPGAGLA